MGAGSRREARERALSLLYEAEMKDQEPGRLLDELPLEADTFAADLVRGVQEQRSRIDSLIDRYAIGWAIERMPSVDRNVLRLAVYEILARPDVPVPAVISEAVELAKRYSTDESGRFVNGILSSVVASVRDEPGDG